MPPRTSRPWQGMGGFARSRRLAGDRRDFLRARWPSCLQHGRTKPKGGPVYDASVAARKSSMPLPVPRGMRRRPQRAQQYRSRACRELLVPPGRQRGVEPGARLESGVGGSPEWDVHARSPTGRGRGGQRHLCDLGPALRGLRRGRSRLAHTRGWCHQTHVQRVSETSWVLR